MNTENLEQFLKTMTVEKIKNVVLALITLSVVILIVTKLQLVLEVIGLFTVISFGKNNLVLAEQRDKLFKMLFSTNNGG